MRTTDRILFREEIRKYDSWQNMTENNIDKFIDDVRLSVGLCNKTRRTTYPSLMLENIAEGNIISLYEYALKSANEGLKDKIKGVFDLKFDDMPKRFRSLGLDDSLVLPSNVINITPLQEKIRLKEKMNPELSYHKDNEDYLENIIKEMELLVREK